MVNKVNKAFKEKWVLLDLQEFRVKKEKLVNRVLQVFKVKQVLRVLVEIQVLEV